LKFVQSATERWCSARAGTQIEIARAHVAHRAQVTGRMTDLR
jgi:hypothetical protein